MNNKCGDCTNCSGIRRSLEKRVFCSIEACVSGMVFGCLNRRERHPGTGSDLRVEKASCVLEEPRLSAAPSARASHVLEFPSLPFLSCELRWSLQMVFLAEQPSAVAAPGPPRGNS